MFTVFANLRIQSSDRLERLATCLDHLQRAQAQAWVFNIRGACRAEAAQLVREKAPCEFRVSHLESEAGWFHDTSRLLEEVRSEFVVFAIEDHFLMANPLTLERTVREMHDLAIDHLEYSWHPRVHPSQLMQGMSPVEGEFTLSATLDVASNAQRHRNYLAHLGYGGSVYIISLCSIMRTELFRKVCRSQHPDRRRFNVMAPFDAERSGCDIDLLPIRIAHPKIELFAALDDDNIHPGSSLHQRGLYRNLSRREQIQHNEGDHNWQYRDLHFAVTPALTRLENCRMHLRIYRYVDRLMEFQEHYARIVSAQLSVMAEAFARVPGLQSLIDYESLSGSASLYFLQAFGGSWAQFRAAEDCQAVRAHETLFANQVHAGFRVEYLEQRVSVGEHRRDGGFAVLADYTPFGPHRPAAAAAAQQAAMVYADMSEMPSEELLRRLRDDLELPQVRALMSDSIVPPGQPWSVPGVVLNELATQRGFELVAAQDYEVTSSPTEIGASSARRCALYLRR
jgi:hypothetical protein